jgi:hypothetical protein
MPSRLSCAAGADMTLSNKSLLKNAAAIVASFFLAVRLGADAGMHVGGANLRLPDDKPQAQAMTVFLLIALATALRQLRRYRDELTRSVPLR